MVKKLNANINISAMRQILALSSHNKVVIIKSARRKRSRLLLEMNQKFWAKF